MRKFAEGENAGGSGAAGAPPGYATAGGAARPEARWEFIGTSCKLSKNLRLRRSLTGGAPAPPDPDFIEKLIRKTQ